MLYIIFGINKFNKFYDKRYDIIYWCFNI